MKKALIIIDMQVMPFVWKDYGGKALHNETLLIKNTKKLLQKAREADAPVYYVLYTEPGNSPRAEGKPLWQVHSEISPRETDIKIVKYFADSFLSTQLELLLKEQGINDLVLCGLQTEFCVDSTCRSAFSHGFRVELASDCHSTFDSELHSAEEIIAHHNGVLSQFAQIKPVAEINMEQSCCHQ